MNDLTAGGESPPRKSRDEMLRAIWGPDGTPGAPAKRRRQPRSAGGGLNPSHFRELSPPAPVKLFPGSFAEEQGAEEEAPARTPVRRRRSAEELAVAEETPARPSRPPQMRAVALTPEPVTCGVAPREQPSGGEDARRRGEVIAMEL
mmetsp:Transcript_65953/g.212746  ORF Transcript_65953/g.212746 Transcript_65953/m.212746 type:complete len:147 (-) Transcript_65953:51-491(-)